MYLLACGNKPHGNVLFVWVEVLRHSQLFFSHVGTFSWVEPVLSNEDIVSCSGQGHNTAPLVRLEPATLRSRVQHSTNLANGAPHMDIFMQMRSADFAYTCTWILGEAILMSTHNIVFF